MSGKYRTIVADPPWEIPGNQMRAGGRRARDTEVDYEFMSLEAIKALPVSAMALEDAALFVWSTRQLFREGAACEVAEALDLFAGGGGWSEACRLLDVQPLGIEIDGAACATREAAGHRTLQGDVAALDPNCLPCTCDFTPFEMEGASVPWHREGCPQKRRQVDLLIASAPCPTFSSAGKGAGRRLTDVIVRCMHELAAGSDTRAERRQEAFEILDPVYWTEEQEKAAKKDREPDREKSTARARRDADLSLLVVEPLRWVLALEPRYIALEQVPEVLGLWSEMATILGTFGYSCWTGILSAEQYGVPQTRKRAILMADREGRVKPPAPTHQRYVSPPRGDEDAPEGLFEVERADRIVRPEDRDLLPWVSMAEALWLEEGDQPSPSPTVSGGGTAGGGGIEVFAGEDARRRAAAAVKFRNGNHENAAVRAAEEPAPTIHFGTNLNEVKWVHDRPSPTIVSARRSDKGIVVGRQPPEGEGRNVGGHGWVDERPSTTVNGDPRISAPGRHDPDEPGSQQKDAIRVSESEALVLQSFRPDYPVQGTKSKRFLQIGNAVPPALALPILGELLGIDWKPIHADYLATYTQQVDLEEGA